MNSILFFSATWCTPCKNMKPIMADFGDIVSYVDVDEDKETTKQWSVGAVPTIIILENGKEKERIIGAVSRGALRKKLNE